MNTTRLSMGHSTESHSIYPPELGVFGRFFFFGAYFCFWHSRYLQPLHFGLTVHNYRKVCSLILTYKFCLFCSHHQTSFFSCNDQDRWWLSHHMLYHYKLKCLLAGFTLATIIFLEVVEATNALSTPSLNCVHKSISLAHDKNCPVSTQTQKIEM